jgi:hypothetical protein
LAVAMGALFGVFVAVLVTIFLFKDLHNEF